MTRQFLRGLFRSIAERSRGASPGPMRQASRQRDIARLVELLLSGKGEVSSIARAREIFDVFDVMEDESKLAFLTMLAERYGPNHARLQKAIDHYRANPLGSASMELHEAAEPRRQELIRRLNLAPGGTERLVRMRCEVLRHLPSNPSLSLLDADFSHLLSSWFNRGFLVLRRIDWSTPSNILEKVIRYEAVHEISGWDDLRLRLEPGDRRCFAFFHPQLRDEPLIFVEVALTRGVPSAIGPLLSHNRTIIRPEDATTAVFYSISNCQTGLKGISFGNFLIKQVIEDLKAEMPTLRTFVTLSPVPGFVEWLINDRGVQSGPGAPRADIGPLEMLDQPDWHRSPSIVTSLELPATRAIARYLLNAKTRSGKPVDPVARFHLGNGARLERLNWLADLSPKGMKQGAGFMANYLYDLRDIERNHEAFANKGVITASRRVMRLIADSGRKRKAT